MKTIEKLLFERGIGLGVILLILGGLYSSIVLICAGLVITGLGISHKKTK